MTTHALLRKSTVSGVRSWRFAEVDGRFMAISDRSERRYYPSRHALDRAISAWSGYGFEPFVHTEPVRRGARQMILDLAAVS